MWKSRSKNYKGQIFTLDAFFAVGVFALALTLLGSSFGELYGRVQGYWPGYSLERMANDAADALLYSCGTPTDWTESSSPKIPGLAENRGDLTLKCVVDLWRLGKLRENLRAGNWDSSPIRESLLRMFGGERFWIKVGVRKATFREGTYEESELVLWSIWPGWQPDQPQPPELENVSRTVVVRRPILLRIGRVLWETPIELEGGGTYENEFSFYLSQFENDAFDFYVRVVSDPDPAYRVDRVSIGINNDPPEDPVEDLEDGYIYYAWMGGTAAFPNENAAGHWVTHGGIENDVWLENPFRPEQLNELEIEAEGGEGTWALIQLVALPACSSPSLALEDPKVLRPGFLEVVLWR